MIRMKKRFKKKINWGELELPHKQFLMSYIPVVIIAIYLALNKGLFEEFILLLFLPPILAWLTAMFGKVEIYYQEV